MAKSLMELIPAKTILSPVKNAPDKYFGSHYTINMYRGCPHGCIYCDTRSDCYQIDDLSRIRVKENALQLLADALPRKRKKGTVITGSMHDPYMALEKKLKLTRGALKLIQRNGFGCHVITKSDLVVRDIDMLTKFTTYAAVSLTITTADDHLAKIIEPHAPRPTERFAALKALRQAGIYAGITLMPTLPFLTDTENNIHELLDRAAEANASYVLFWPGMTLRDRCRKYYYDQLNIHFPHLVKKYEQFYGEEMVCNSPNGSSLYSLFQKKCAQYKIAQSIKPWVPPEQKQATLPF
ncbi:MAG: radical SAM protein [Desulfovibrio sp.]